MYSRYLPRTAQLTTAPLNLTRRRNYVKPLTIDIDRETTFHQQGVGLCVNLKEMTGVGVKLIMFAICHDGPLSGGSR